MIHTQVILFHSTVRAQTHMIKPKEVPMGDHLKATCKLAVDDVYIPVNRKNTLKPDKVNALLRA